MRTIAHMLGIPREDGDLFITWIHQILELGISDDEELIKGVKAMSAYFVTQIARRKTQPTDDLISTLMNARDPSGQPLSDAHVLGALRLLLIAGIGHHVERDWIVTMASGENARRPRATGRRALIDPRGH